MLRMSVATSEAARALLRARWGNQRVRTIAAELEERVGELDAETADRLSARLDASRAERETTR